MDATFGGPDFVFSSHQGQTLTLRLASLVFYDTRSAGSSATQANAGFDNAQITVTSATPEPGAGGLALAWLTLAGLGLRLRRPTGVGKETR